MLSRDPSLRHVTDFTGRQPDVTVMNNEARMSNDEGIIK
jgi:hypothetical protein